MVHIVSCNACRRVRYGQILRQRSPSSSLPQNLSGDCQYLYEHALMAYISLDLHVYSYSRVAYCDVTGRESRLPLRVAGQGFGPRLMFSFDTLDIQNVFINSAHAYEVCMCTYVYKFSFSNTHIQYLPLLVSIAFRSFWRIKGTLMQSTS